MINFKPIDHPDCDWPVQQLFIEFKLCYGYANSDQKNQFLFHTNLKTQLFNVHDQIVSICINIQLLFMENHLRCGHYKCCGLYTSTSLASHTITMQVINPNFLVFPIWGTKHEMVMIDSLKLVWYSVYRTVADTTDFLRDSTWWRIQSSILIFFMVTGLLLLGSHCIHLYRGKIHIYLSLCSLFSQIHWLKSYWCKKNTNW